MPAIFIAAAPAVEIIKGVVNLKDKDGEAYMLPSTFRMLIDDGGRKLAAFDLEQRAAIPFRKE